MSPASSEEQIVRPFTPLPPGYVFVPKGNVYITKNCRKLTQAENRIVYTVQSDRKTILGVRVPNSIYTQVLADNKATAATRAENVRRKDQNLEDKTESELLSCFPRIPREHVPLILRHTLQKRSRRIGRSKEIPLSQVVELAVRAYIRHKLTDYDVMLRKGVNREQARRRIQGSVDEKVIQWGGTVKASKVQKSNKKDSKRIHGSPKRLPSKVIVSRIQKVSTKPGAKTGKPKSRKSSPCRAGESKRKPKRKAKPTALRSLGQRPVETRGNMLAFRPRLTNENKDAGGQIPHERTIIVISDDEDSADADDMEIDTSLNDSDASYQDDSDF